MTHDSNSTDAFAQSAINATDWRKMDAEGLSAREYLDQHLDVDPDDFDDRKSLQAAVLESREDMDADENNIAAAAVGAPSRTFGDSPEDIEALSESVLTVSDLREIERRDTDATSYVEAEWGVDPRGYRDESKLREAVNEAKQ